MNCQRIALAQTPSTSKSPCIYIFFPSLTASIISFAAFLELKSFELGYISESDGLMKLLT